MAKGQALNGAVTPQPRCPLPIQSRDSPSLAAAMTSPGKKRRRRCQPPFPCQGLHSPPRTPPSAGVERPHTGGSRGRGGGGGGTPRPGPRRSQPLPGASAPQAEAGPGAVRRGRPGVPGGSRGAAAARPAPIDFPLWSFATKGRIQTLPVSSNQRAERLPSTDWILLLPQHPIGRLL